MTPMPVEQLVYLGIGVGMTELDPYYLLSKNAIRSLGFGIVRAREEWHDTYTVPTVDEIFSQMCRCEAVMLTLCFQVSHQRAEDYLTSAVTVFEREFEAFERFKDPTIDLNNSMQAHIH